MLVLYFLSIFLFDIVLAESNNNKVFCPFDQGKVEFCRTSDSAGTSSTKLLLRLPINAIKMGLHRIEDSEVKEWTYIEEPEMDQRLVSPNLDATACSSESGIELSKFIDVNDKKLHDDSWYVMCAEYNVVERSASGTTKNHKCKRCTMVKMTPPSKFLYSSWVKGRMTVLEHDGSTIIRYAATEMPFTSVVVTGYVIDVDNKSIAFRFEQYMQPNQQAYIRVPSLNENRKYIVVTDLDPQNRNGTYVLVDYLPLILFDYLRFEDENRVAKKKALNRLLGGSDGPVLTGFEW